MDPSPTLCFFLLHFNLSKIRIILSRKKELEVGAEAIVFSNAHDFTVLICLKNSKAPWNFLKFFRI